MTIDCDECQMRETSACYDCIVPLILQTASRVEVDVEEMVALNNLAAEGLLPPLRLVVDGSGGSPDRRVG
jgi:hypothetical protein